MRSAWARNYLIGAACALAALALVFGMAWLLLRLGDCSGGLGWSALRCARLPDGLGAAAFGTAMIAGLLVTRLWWALLALALIPPLLSELAARRRT